MTGASRRRIDADRPALNWKIGEIIEDACAPHVWARPWRTEPPGSSSFLAIDRAAGIYSGRGVQVRGRVDYVPESVVGVSRGGFEGREILAAAEAPGVLSPEHDVWANSGVSRTDPRARRLTSC